MTRILVAEDDPDLRGAIGDLLTAHGFEVVGLEDGAEVADYIRDSVELDAPRPRVHALLTDLRMPNMSGAEVLAYFQSLGWHLPTVVLTAFGDPETRRELLELGAAVVLPKPVNPNELVSTLELVTRGHV